MNPDLNPYQVYVADDKRNFRRVGSATTAYRAKLLGVRELKRLNAENDHGVSGLPWTRYGVKGPDKKLDFVHPE